MSDLLYWVAVIFVFITVLPLIINWADTFFRIKAFFSYFFYNNTRFAIVHPSVIYDLHRRRLYSWKENESYYKKFKKFENRKNYNEEEKEKYNKLFNHWSELQNVYEKLIDSVLQVNNDFVTGKGTLVMLKKEWEEKVPKLTVYYTGEEESIVKKIGELNPNYMNQMRSVWGFGY